MGPAAAGPPFFEGSYEDTNELEDQFDDKLVTVKAGETQVRKLEMTNDGVDKATVTVTFVNAEDPAG